MKATQRKRIVSFHRILDLVEEDPLEPPIPAATALVTELTTTTTALDTLVASQDLALGTVRGATLDRRKLKSELLEFLKDLAQTARVFSPGTHPGLAAEMRMTGAGKSYAVLLGRARGFHTALVPVKADFIAYGSPATVDADLLALITKFEDATERKNDGRATHIGGAAGLDALCKAGVLTVQKLDAIFSKVYKTDAVKLAAWKAARRVERPAAPAEEEPAPAPAPTPGS
jgi:hypothetical protein